MRTMLVILLIAASSLLACGKKSDVNEKNFSAAMKEYFDKKGDKCLDMGFRRQTWPIDLSQGEKDPQLTALATVGLVSSMEVEVPADSTWDPIPRRNGVQRKQKVTRYTLTDAAKPYVRQGPDKGSPQARLCWGKMALQRVIKWEGPLNGNVQVTYIYQVNDVAPWAKRAEVQAAFGEVHHILEGAGTRELAHVLHLTSLGWEPRYDFFD